MWLVFNAQLCIEEENCSFALMEYVRIKVMVRVRVMVMVRVNRSLEIAALSAHQVVVVIFLYAGVEG